MGKQSLVLYFAFLVALVFLLPEVAFAGVGGSIASVLAKGLFGRLALSAMVFVFFPIVFLAYIKERLAEKSTLGDLKRLSVVSPAFAWDQLKMRIRDSYTAVHGAWNGGDLSGAAMYMTPWFWQNQQMNYLDRWKADGLLNICRVRGIDEIRPIFVSFRNWDDNCDGSKIVVAVSADIEDYMVHRESQLLCMGKPGFHNSETLWTFVLKDGEWVVSNIETTEQWLAYVKLSNEIPEVLPAPSSHHKKNA